MTILMAMMGYTENGDLGIDYPSEMKNPRGILDYKPAGHAKADVTWKLTGNLGGVDVHDRPRGPLNEGGLFAERQGCHLPGAPTSLWRNSGPTDDIPTPGGAFYATDVRLGISDGYDIPLAFSFGNRSSNDPVTPFRPQIYVDGWQFGRYIHNIGPQRVFPVPQGIWNYRGNNHVALSR